MLLVVKSKACFSPHGFCPPLSLHHRGCWPLSLGLHPLPFSLLPWCMCSRTPKGCYKFSSLLLNFDVPLLGKRPPLKLIHGLKTFQTALFPTPGHLSLEISSHHLTDNVLKARRTFLLPRPSFNQLEQVLFLPCSPHTLPCWLSISA